MIKREALPPKYKPLVLIVDDALKNLQILAGILTKENYEIAMAESGNEALKMLNDITPDLILLDVLMPNMNGFETCMKIKEIPKLKDIPVIFLTAKTDAEDVVKGFDYGATDYIPKPFKIPELLARIKVHIELKEKTRMLGELNQQLEEKVQVRTSQLQIANKRLAMLDKAKTDFLWLISNELRSPLNNISATIELLKKAVNTEEKRDYCNTINTAAISIERFIKIAQILTELRADKHEIQRQKIRVRDLVNYSIDLIRQDAQLKKIELIKEFKNDTTDLFVDLSLIQKCFENVLENAVRFSPVNSTITVRGYLASGKYYIEVIDKGKGFSKEVLGFLNGVSSNENSSRNRDDMGMGLVMSKFIIEANLGKLQAENQSDGGAIVRLVFELE